MTGAAPRFRPPSPIVESKLRPPTQRHASVDRPRLLEPLLDRSGPRVVALIAPPGYGKTTLLAQWLAHERRPAAWLTLDDLDNDPAVLLTYLGAALDRIGPISASLRAAVGAPPERILATAVPRLATDIAHWRRPALLVLDDAHRLVDRTALDALGALIDHLPATIRLAIAGRSEPDLPFARLRAAGDLDEIGAAALALRDPETAAIATAEGLPLSADTVRALTERTEGWVTGVHLATLALARGEVGRDAVGSVSGRDRYVAAYLRSEVERHLTPADVAILTRTSILEVVTADVAPVVSGIPDAWERLGSIARRSLLIQEVDGAATTYRYHNLLRDFLTTELDRREPGSRRDLHRRVADWYAAEGDLGQAADHALASGDVDTVARLVSVAALPTFYGGHPGTVDRWITTADPAVFEHHPPAAIIAAWMHLLRGRPDDADRMADIAERSTFVGDPGDGSASFESGRAMLRAVMARRGPADVLANAEFAAAAEPAHSPWRANALWLLGSAHRLHGRPTTADEALGSAVAAGSASSGTAMVAVAMRSSIAMARGDWAAAEALAADARARLAQASFEEILPAMLTHAVTARVAAHRGDTARARASVVRAQLVRPLASHAAPWFAVDALLEMARAYLALSDPAGAQVAIREAEQVVRRRPAIGVLTSELVDMRRRLADAAATLVGSSSLTTAELRLLPLLPTYLSFQEIADRLLVSRNTVKTQAMSIYGKLQVSSRSEAVERAVELGLLEPFPGFEPAPRARTD